MKNILLNNVFNEEKYVTIKKDKRPTGTQLFHQFIFSTFLGLSQVIIKINRQKTSPTSIRPTRSQTVTN